MDSVMIGWLVDWMDGLIDCLFSRHFLMLVSAICSAQSGDHHHQAGPY